MVVNFWVVRATKCTGCYYFYLTSADFEVCNMIKTYFYLWKSVFRTSESTNEVATLHNPNTNEVDIAFNAGTMSLMSAHVLNRMRFVEFPM